MSLHEYQCGVKLWKDDLPFYALIMAAMLGADDENVVKLQAMFPETYRELDIRYNAAGGVHPDD